MTRTFNDNFATITLDEGTPIDRFYAYNDAKVTMIYSGENFTHIMLDKSFRYATDAKECFLTLVSLYVSGKDTALNDYLDSLNK